MKLPKSVPDAKRYLVWLFPSLLVFGNFALMRTSSEGFVAVVISMIVVVTGWLSFSIVPEHVYNDLLLICDLALLSSYGLLIHFSMTLSAHTTSSDLSLWLVSGSIFAFYAIWDFCALVASDTRAIASSHHLRRFGFVCLLISVGFFGSAVVVHQVLRFGPRVSEVWPSVLRGLWLMAWLTIIYWWHQGRVRAAIADGRN